MEKLRVARCKLRINAKDKIQDEIAASLCFAVTNERMTAMREGWVPACAGIK